jgi:uncharacterized protein (UPF0212 family)
MANCPECGAVVGIGVTKCPQCGAYQSKAAAVADGIQALGCLIMCVVGLVFLAIAVWACAAS